MRMHVFHGIHAFNVLNSQVFIRVKCLGYVHSLLIFKGYAPTLITDPMWLFMRVLSANKVLFFIPSKIEHERESLLGTREHR